MIIALALTLLLALTVLRHVMEPACPGCAAKCWKTGADTLSCTRCGWSTVLAPQVVPATELAAAVPANRYAGAQS